jgi:thioredoxin reductase (NADPH)
MMCLGLCCGGQVLTQLAIATGLAVVIIVLLTFYLTLQRERREEEALADARAAGLNQPVSLHPMIDLESCIGSGACVDVCPEKVLGRVGGVTQMITAAGCIGHGICQNSCPVGAIALVFGTAERGIDLPLLRRNYQSNKDAIFIVGELGGMGLIRNAMRQGLKAVGAGVTKALADPALPPPAPGAVDVIIVGGGPAGLAAALECVKRELSFVLLEQYKLGGSVAHYPRRKLVFTEMVKLPLVGKFGRPEMLKEELIAEFERVCLQAGITIHEGRRVTGVTGRAGDFTVEAAAEGASEVYRGRSVVLAIGRRGTPRQLGVPGEDLSHVVYRLIDSEQYRHRKVLCVGGGDSSLEAAVSLAGAAGTEVHLSYRGDSFYRAKKKNREEIEAAVARGRVRLHMSTNVVQITPNRVTLVKKDGGQVNLEIEDVVVNVGGLLPTPFLESIGIKVETKFGDVHLAPKGKSSRFVTAPSRSTRLTDGSRRTRPSTRLPRSTRLKRRSTRSRKRGSTKSQPVSDDELRGQLDSESRPLGTGDSDHFTEHGSEDVQ